MKLVLISQQNCSPCQIMKNQILDRIEELNALGCEFEYVELNSLPDKDTFVQKFQLTATPTSWVEVDGFMSEKFTGYVDIDTLFEFVSEIKGEK